MPLIARQRSRLAVLAVLALVGSLLAVSAVPAAAAGDGKPTAETTASACVGAAAEDAGFTDMAGSFAEDAANCLAHYGITVGTSVGVFDPDASITRLQMALFMVRAAGPAGIEMDDPEDQGFGDIDGFTDEIQDGINQAAALGIMSGSDGSFNPTGMVSREDMAVILNDFLAVAQIDGLDEDGNVLDADGDTFDVDTPFADLGSVPFAAYNSINKLYELGVATGTGDGSVFSPTMLVNRGQMAVFVTRALAHTNARPVGLSIQAATSGDTESDHEIMVSLRDEDHQPVPDELIDVISSTNPDEAFDDDGECDSGETEGNCKIDDDDSATEPEGNVTVTVTLPEDPGSVMVWIWTGQPEDEFDSGETVYAAMWIDAILPAEKTNVTDDTKMHSDYLQFGDTVTFTLQLVDKNGDPVAKADYDVTVNTIMEDTTDGDSAGDGAKRPDRQVSESVMTTDAAGRIEVSYTADDPDEDEDEDRITLTVMLAPDGETFPLDNDANDQDGTAANIQIIWADDDAVPTTLALDQSVNYHETDDDGVRNVVTATLVDQYGDPIRNKKVALWSNAVHTDDGKGGLGGDDDNGEDDGPAALRTTSKSGVASKSYSRSLVPGFTEMIDASFRIVDGDCNDVDDDPNDCDESDDTVIAADAISHYWAIRITPASGTSTAEVTTATVLVADTDSNTVVVLDGTTPKLATYKGGANGDHFELNGDNISIDEFERILSAAGAGGSPAADVITIEVGDDDDDINTFNITTNN